MEWENILMFLMGFFSCAFLFFSFSSGLEVPFKTGLSVIDGDGSAAPSDWISEDDIIIFEDNIVLRIKGATLSNYADSGSMVPVLDKGANGIRIVPDSADDIEVGDIVSFRMNGLLVVHRVVEKGVDEDGVWFSMKGDANMLGDGKVRFEDIEYVTVGIIY